jgi:hypothetical protein
MNTSSLSSSSSSRTNNNQSKLLVSLLLVLGSMVSMVGLSVINTASLPSAYAGGQGPESGFEPCPSDTHRVGDICVSNDIVPALMLGQSGRGSGSQGLESGFEPCPSDTHRVGDICVSNDIVPALSAEQSGGGSDYGGAGPHDSSSRSGSDEGNGANTQHCIGCMPAEDPNNPSVSQNINPSVSDPPRSTGKLSPDELSEGGNHDNHEDNQRAGGSGHGNHDNHEDNQASGNDGDDIIRTG